MSIASRRNLVALGTGCLLASPAWWPATVDAAQTGAATEFATLARGAHSGVREPLEATVRTPEGWAALWARHAGRAATAPSVDFAIEMIVAVFAGTRPTSGYAVEITQVLAMDQGLRISYRVRRPPAGAVVLQALTAPFHIIRVPRTDGPVDFVQDTA